MAHVGQAKGDYVQVTTFRYVGKGGGEFHMQHNKEEPRPGVSWKCWVIGLCIMLAVPVLAWIVLPEQTNFGSLFAQTGSIFVTSNQLIHGGGTTLTTTPGLAVGGISFTLRVDNVDYARLAANPKAYRAFVFAVKEAVVFYTGHGVTTKRTSITLRRAFQTVRADIVPPCGTDVKRLETGMNFTSLAKAVTANLHTVGGWKHRVGSPVSASVVNSATFAASCDVLTAEPSAYDGLAMEPQGAASLPEPEPAATATPTLAAHRAIVIGGAGGPSAFQVNGVYLLQADEFHGKPVFKKDKAVDVWMAFVKGRWYITDAQRKNDNTGGGWLYSVDVDNPDPVEVEEWQEWDGQKWAAVPTLKVQWQHAEAEREGGSGPGSLRGRSAGSSSNSSSDSDEDRDSGRKVEFRRDPDLSRQMLRSTVNDEPRFKVVARHSGCSNWKEIKFGGNSTGADLVMETPQQCGERCYRTQGCVGFNFFDIVIDTICATGVGPETGSDKPGSCSLWNGTCTAESNQCWTNYEMQP